MGGYNPIEGKVVPCVKNNWSSWGGLGCCTLYIGMIVWGIIDFILNCSFLANGYYYGVVGIIMDIMLVIIGIEAIAMDGKVRALLCRIVNIIYAIVVILAIVGLIQNIIWVVQWTNNAWNGAIPGSWYFNTIVSFLWVLISAWFVMGSCESLAVQVHG